MSKKRVFSLAMAAMMLFSATAYGATVDGVTLADLEKEDGKFNVTYTGAADGKEYMIWAVKGTHTDANEVSFAQSNVLYINQNTADGTSVTFDAFLPMKSEDSTVLVSGQGMEAPVIVGYIKGEGNTISGTIGLQGRTDNFGGALITFTNCDTGEVVGPITTDEEGAFEITLSNGTYEMIVTRAGFLSYTDYTFEVNESINWEEAFDFTLIPGDMNDDGFVNGRDFMAFLRQFGEEGDDVLADFDGNTFVNGRDFMTFLRVFGQQATEIE